MSRELRRVPPDWQHPRDDQGNFEPLVGGSFAKDFETWHEGLHQWLTGDHPYQKPDWSVRSYIEWEGNSPDPDAYSLDWTPDETTAYQIYETVSEGTPVSPVFRDKGAIIKWLTTHGMRQGTPLSQKAAEQFVENGYAPSLIYTPETGLVYGYEFIEGKST